MNNLKVIADFLKRLTTDEGDSWHELQATMFLRLIKVREQEWNRVVNDIAIDASRADSYDAGEMVNTFHKRIKRDGFCSELINAEGNNVACHIDAMLDACIENSFRVRAALKCFFEEKVEFLKCSRMRD